MSAKIDYGYTSPTNPINPFLVFIHGAGGDKTQWINQKEYFREEGYGIVTLSLPSHGDSSELKIITIETYAESVNNLLLYLELEKIILIGHSMGGAITLHLALYYPDLPIEKLVLIGTGAKLGVAPIFFETIEKNFGEGLKLMGKFAYHESAFLQVKLDNEEVLRNNGPEILLNDFKACDKFDIRTDLNKISKETLIICGEDDLMTPVKYSSYLSENIRNSKLSIIPEAGHFVYQEKAHKVNDLIHRFIEENGEII